MRVSATALDQAKRGQTQCLVHTNGSLYAPAMLVQSHTITSTHGDSLTVYKIRVQLDVIVLPGAALNRCVCLWARSRTRDRCDDGTSREILRNDTAEWRCECALSSLDSPSEPPDPNQAHRPYRTEPRRCRGVKAYILELAASCLRASLPPASSSSLSYVLDTQLINVILYGHDIL